jgi:hypothetical protein
MSRVITFSRVFPAYHPKAGQPTYFVEKLIKGLHRQGHAPFDVDCDFCNEMYHLSEPKWHTIRAGKRWKQGDKFSPRVWSGTPYKTKQIIIAPEIEIKKEWRFEINSECGITIISINGKVLSESFFYPLDQERLEPLALNDGLSIQDLKDWFKYPKPFQGQIICWNDQIEY